MRDKKIMGRYIDTLDNRDNDTAEDKTVREDFEMRGTVLETDKDNNTVILITPDGDIRKIILPPVIPEIGEEIFFNAADECSSHEPKTAKTTSPKRRRSLTGRILATAAVMIMGLTSIFFAYNYYTTAMYFCMDINPSLEIEANRYNKVLEVVALNDSGTELTESANFKNMDIEDALKILVREAHSKNYLEDERDNLIMLSFVKVNKNIKDTDFEKIKNSLLNFAEDAEDEGIPYYDMIVNEIEPEMHKEARREGSSVNRKIVRDFIRDNNITLSPEFDTEDGNMGLIIAEIAKTLGKIPHELQTSKGRDKAATGRGEDRSEEGEGDNTSGTDNPVPPQTPGRDTAPGTDHAPGQNIERKPNDTPSPPEAPGRNEFPAPQPPSQTIPEQKLKPEPHDPEQSEPKPDPAPAKPEKPETPVDGSEPPGHSIRPNDSHGDTNN